MRVLIINSVCGYRSTGKICASLLKDYLRQGDEAMIAYGRIGAVPNDLLPYAYRIGKPLDVKVHGITTRIFDKHGLGSVLATKKFLRWAEEYNPDLLWLHNLHGYYINYELLFKWIKSRPHMKVRWTLHDCWSFTGHCSHFVVVKCEKWKNGCYKCPQKSSAYPQSYLLDNSCDNYRRKKKSFTGVKDLTLIVPSNWLKQLVKQSFLKDYNVEVVPNKVDKDIFYYRKSDFRAKNQLEDKFIILSVSNIWSVTKGYNDILKLASMIDSNLMRIVIVGVSHEQLIQLPRQIVGIERTDNQEQLAEIYSAADVFFNPTYQDTFPTVNLEAEACNLPVVTYATGGAPETIANTKSESIEVGNLSKALLIFERMADEKNNEKEKSFVCC